jgi:hypothetical protein
MVSNLNIQEHVPKTNGQSSWHRDGSDHCVLNTKVVSLISTVDIAPHFQYSINSPQPHVPFTLPPIHPKEKSPTSTWAWGNWVGSWGRLRKGSLTKSIYGKWNLEGKMPNSGRKPAFVRIPTKGAGLPPPSLRLACGQSLQICLQIVVAGNKSQTTLCKLISSMGEAGRLPPW